MTSVIDFSSNLKYACKILREAQRSGAGLMILSGAGLSVQSGVPVFRMADGSMSADFLKFLGDYNAARKKHGLEEASSWFSFSVPEMFRAETALEAWQYWRWRMLRALVQPAEDYQQLNKIIAAFGTDRVFALTSNCDMLHVSAGLPEENIFEIHGSLGYLQCSRPCDQTLYPVDESFLLRLRDEPLWVPMCPECKTHCLRPNVMIFGDYALVDRRLDEQEERFQQFKKQYLNKDNTRKNTSSSSNTCNSAPPAAVVLEIGAGRVVSSIRRYGESLGLVDINSNGAGVGSGGGLIRINPSTSECQHMELGVLSSNNNNHSDTDNDTTTDAARDCSREEDLLRPQLASKYFPLNKKANEALTAICLELDL